MMPARELSILVVSYYFPPNAAVGAKRVASFCKRLPEFGIRPIVLTIDNVSCERLDLSLQTFEQLQIERVPPVLTVIDRYQRWAQKGALVEPSKGMRNRNQRAKHSYGLREHALALLYFPDMQRGWYRPAIRAAAQILRRQKTDAIFSSGPPWTAHAVAYALSSRYKLPWIVDFRDAWASESWRKYADHGKGWPAWRNRLDLRTEDRWVRYAARVVCTTDQQHELLLRVHPRLDSNRVITIPNGFDGREQGSTVGKPSANGSRTFLHIGTLYAGRHIAVFCKAIASLIHDGRFLSHRIKVKLVGYVEEHIKREALGATPEFFANQVIEFHPPVDWLKAQESLHEADVLLIFQGDHTTAIPVKFFEYLRTGKPILALVGDGALRNIVLRTASGFVADPEDQAEITSAIQRAVVAKPRTAEEVERVAKEFDFSKLTAELAAAIRCVAK